MKSVLGEVFFYIILNRHQIGLFANAMGWEFKDKVHGPLRY